MTSARWTRSVSSGLTEGWSFVLAVGVHELACSRVSIGESVIDLEDTLVGCAVRLVAEEEEAWT